MNTRTPLRPGLAGLALLGCLLPAASATAIGPLFPSWFEPSLRIEARLYDTDGDLGLIPFVYTQQVPGMRISATTWNTNPPTTETRYDRLDFAPYYTGSGVFGPAGTPYVFEVEAPWIGCFTGE
jgi:hypothetical protein